MAAARRVQLHRLIGTRLEAGYAEQAGEIAAELAVHFERGRDTQRAVQYLGQAGENAARKSAHREVIAHLTKGLDLLKTLPDTPERARQELPLQLALGGPLIATTGYTTLETRAAFGRARELCQQVGETPQLFTALSGLQSFYLVRAEYQTARELAEQGLGLAQHSQNPTLLMAARLGMGTILVCSESSFLPSNIFSKVLLCPILSNTIPLPHKRLRIRESRASPLLPLPCGIWVIRTRRWK